MTEEPSFQRELARTRHSPERIYGLVIWALAISGVGGYGLLKDGSSAAGYSAAAHEVKEWRRLLRDGVTTDAVVSLVKETYEEVRGRRGNALRKYGWIVHYRYKDQAGETHAGESGYLPRHEAMACRVGDACAIRYDPREPEKSVWIARA